MTGAYKGRAYPSLSLFLAESIELFCHAVDFGIEFFCVDGRHLLVTHDGLAIDDDGVDVHGVSGIDGKGDAVEVRVPVIAASVHEDDIGECALFQLAEVIIAEAFGAIDGRHFHGFGRSDGEGIVGIRSYV